MGLFSRKPKTATAGKEMETKNAVSPRTMPAHSGVSNDLSHVLKNPRITEKATFASGVSAYVFDVATAANKKQIAAAIQKTYKVTPRAVRIVNIRPKMVRNMRTGKRGVKQGGKKAYVYLKKGETITVS